MRLRFRSTSTTLTLHDVAGLDDLARILHEPVGELRDVHEAVLVHADVDERAEVRDVGDHAFEHHAGLEIARAPGRRP